MLETLRRFSTTARFWMSLLLLFGATGCQQGFWESGVSSKKLVPALSFHRVPPQWEPGMEDMTKETNVENP